VDQKQVAGVGRGEAEVAQNNRTDSKVGPRKKGVPTMKRKSIDRLRRARSLQRRVGVNFKKGTKLEYKGTKFILRTRKKQISRRDSTELSHSYGINH